MPELIRQALDAPLGLVNRVAILLQRDVLRREREAEVGEPAAIGLRPTGASWIASALPQKERLQPMLRLGTQADGIFQGPHQIAQGLIVICRNVNRRELAGAMQRARASPSRRSVLIRSRSASARSTD